MKEQSNDGLIIDEGEEKFPLVKILHCYSMDGLFFYTQYGGNTFTPKHW
jgi:hypothetical protein